MKSCPTCNRTFEDTFTFCLADGSLLNAPFDPQATQRIPEAKQTQPTEVLTEEKIEQEIPPTVASAQPEQKQENLVSTIAAPAPAFESPQIENLPAQPVRKSNRRLWIIAAILIPLSIVAIILYKTRDTSQKHYEAGYKFESQSKFAEAEAEYRKAIQLEPNKGSWHFTLAFFLLRQKRATEAEAEYREGVRLDPNESTYRSLWAGELENQKRYDEAERELREELRIDSNITHPSVTVVAGDHWDLGMVLEKQKKYTEAEAEYREAIRLDPSVSTYQEYLKEVLAAQGKPTATP